jgi:YggT family protein
MNVVVQIIEFLFTIYIWMIIIRAVISWVGPYSKIPIAKFLTGLTDPLLLRIRSLLPLPGMAIDISPVIAIVLLMILRHLLGAILS